MVFAAVLLALAMSAVWLFFWGLVAQAIVRIGIPHERWWSMPLALALFLPWLAVGAFGIPVTAYWPFVALGVVTP